MLTSILEPVSIPSEIWELKVGRLRERTRDSHCPALLQAAKDLGENSL